MAEKFDNTRMQLSSKLMVQSDAAYRLLKAAAYNNSALKTTIAKIAKAFRSLYPKKDVKEVKQ